jgi:hypothetical protein
MFWPEEETPLTKRSKELAEYLKLYCLVFLLLVVAKCFVLGPLQLLGDLLAVLVLFMGTLSFDYCYLTMFVFLTLSSVVDLVARLGLLVQRRMPVFEAKLAGRTVAAVLSLILYFAGWWLTLLAYREFKAASMGLGTDFVNDPERQRLNRDEEHGDEEHTRRNNQNARAFEAFQGRGIAVG